MPIVDEFDGQDHFRDIVLYRAVVRFSVEQSALWYSPAYSRETTLSLLAGPMPFRYRGGQWPPAEPNARNLDFLAYTKLAAGMAIRTNTTNDAAPLALRQSVYAKNVDMDPGRHAVNSEEYEAFRVCVAWSVSAEHRVTIQSHNEGRKLPFKIKLDKQPLAMLIETKLLVQADLLEKANAARY
jgi:hypothetical protein